MSTMKTLKRLALVAVSALGIGLVPSVTANAAITEGTLTATQVTSGRLGAPVVVKVTFNFTYDGTDSVMLSAKLLTAAPGSSTKDGDDFFWIDGDDSANLWAQPELVPTAGGAQVIDAAAEAVPETDSTDADENGISFNLSGASSGTEYTLTAYGSFTPDKAGTWNWVFWNDKDNGDDLDSTEKQSTLSIAVTDSAISTVAVTSVSGTSVTTASTTSAASEEALVKVRLVGSDGRPAIPATTEFVTLTSNLSGYFSGINDGSTFDQPYVFNASGAGATSIANIGEAISGTSVQSVNLNYYNFNHDGSAYVTVKNATAQTVTLTATVGGTAVTSTTSQEFVTASVDSDVQGIQSADTNAGVDESATGANPSFTVGAGSKSGTFYVAGATSAGKTAVEVVDTEGWISGLKGAQYTRSVTLSTTAKTATYAVAAMADLYANSFAVAWNSGTKTGAAFTLQADADDSQQITISAATSDALSVVSSAGSNIRSGTGASHTMTLRCKDIFGSAKANVTLSASIAGRNAATTIGQQSTNASGDASFTYTDTSTSTTSLVDTITFSGCGTTASVTVTYTTATDLGVSAVDVEGAASEDDYAGQTETAISAGDDPSTNSRVAMTATVTDANGAPLAGVPVTWTISGTPNAAIVKTATVDYATTYTNASGVATTYIFGWGPAGSTTVVATAGGKVDATPGLINWVSASASSARTLDAAVSGNQVTFTAKDRYGNPVANAQVDVTRSGNGLFGNGASTQTVNTDKSGVAVVTLSGNTAATTVTGTFPSSYTQARDVAGKIAATAVTAAVAGTTTGTGASLAPAGIHTASVSVAAEGPSAAQVAADAATDAALEAIDAANAATDAANLAAEAADAATVAAEEARDAADAATAAVEALASEVATLIAGLKAQITTLANTVAKIAKKVKA